MNTYTKNQEDFLIKFYPTNGFDFCSDKLSIPRRLLQSKVQRMGLKLTKEKRGEIIRLNKPKKPLAEYSIEPTQFYAANTPEVAYILGLLWADGYVLHKSKNGKLRNRVSITNQIEDFHVFVKTLNKVGRWNVKIRSPENRKEQGTAEISNRPLVEFLMKNDYTSKSTASACKILSTIPEHLKHYWFRGLFDGDGCIYFNPSGLHIKISIASSYNQDWKYVEDLFTNTLLDKSFRIKRNLRKNGNGYSKIEVTKRSTILKFLDYIYSNYSTDQIGLPRKYEKYLKVVEREKHCTAKKANRLTPC
jgi:hypothetical protein